MSVHKHLILDNLVVVKNYGHDRMVRLELGTKTTLMRGQTFTWRWWRMKDKRWWRLLLTWKRMPRTTWRTMTRWCMNEVRTTTLKARRKLWIDGWEVGWAKKPERSNGEVWSQNKVSEGDNQGVNWKKLSGKRVCKIMGDISILKITL